MHGTMNLKFITEGVEISLSKHTGGWKDNIRINHKEIMYKVIIFIYRVSLTAASFFELTQASKGSRNEL
jgi:hypothetical protein